jgi:hypothetical protein
MVENVALDIEVRPVANLDYPPLSYRRDQSLLDRRQRATVGVLDLHSVLDPSDILLNLGQFTPRWVFEDQGLGYPECLPVDLVDPLATVRLDQKSSPTDIRRWRIR